MTVTIMHLGLVCTYNIEIKPYPYSFYTYVMTSSKEQEN